MSVIVSKFGGSSTASAGMFRRIGAILRQSADRRYVVLSAPGAPEPGGEKVTELLYRCWRLRAAGASIEAPLAAVQRRFREIALPLGLPDPSEAVHGEIEAALAVSEAHTVSRGEQLCARLFSRWSGIPWMDAAALVAFDAEGMLDVPRTLRQFEDAAARHPRLVIPGFYGAGPDGSVALLSRNGSDVTGALAAAGVDAALCENWTDVPGLMTADPGVVPEARLVPQISYRLMRALSRAGARVLHPDCLDPVALADIPTRLRSTLDTRCFGTLIANDCPCALPCVTGRRATGREGLASVSVFGASPGAKAALVRRLNAAPDREDWQALHFLVESERFEDALRAAHGVLYP